MRSVLLGAVVALVGLTQAALGGQAETRVLDLINAQRKAAGCPALAMNPALQQAAQTYANAMATQNFFSHRAPNGAGPSQRAWSVGYRFHKLAENIAAGQKSPEAVVKTWMNSPGHRKNILTCGLRETGIGLVYSRDDKPLRGQSYPMHYYWVQMFGTP